MRIKASKKTHNFLHFIDKN